MRRTAPLDGLSSVENAFGVKYSSFLLKPPTINGVVTLLFAALIFADGANCGMLSDRDRCAVGCESLANFNRLSADPFDEEHAVVAERGEVIILVVVGIDLPFVFE